MNLGKAFIAGVIAGLVMGNYGDRSFDGDDTDEYADVSGQSDDRRSNFYGLVAGNVFASDRFGLDRINLCRRV